MLVAAFIAAVAVLLPLILAIPVGLDDSLSSHDADLTKRQYPIRCDGATLDMNDVQKCIDQMLAQKQAVITVPSGQGIHLCQAGVVKFSGRALDNNGASATGRDIALGANNVFARCTTRGGSGLAEGSNNFVVHITEQWVKRDGGLELPSLSSDSSSSTQKFSTRALDVYERQDRSQQDEEEIQWCVEKDRFTCYAYAMPNDICTNLNFWEHDPFTIVEPSSNTTHCKFFLQEDCMGNSWSCDGFCYLDILRDMGGVISAKCSWLKDSSNSASAIDMAKRLDAPVHNSKEFTFCDGPAEDNCSPIDLENGMCTDLTHLPHDKFTRLIMLDRASHCDLYLEHSCKSMSWGCDSANDLGCLFDDLNEYGEVMSVSCRWHVA